VHVDFSNINESTAWWKRTLAGEYFPAIDRHNDGLVDYLKRADLYSRSDKCRPSVASSDVLEATVARIRLEIEQYYGLGVPLFTTCFLILLTKLWFL